MLSPASGGFIYYTPCHSWPWPLPAPTCLSDFSKAAVAPKEKPL